MVNGHFFTKIIIAVITVAFLIQIIPATVLSVDTDAGTIASNNYCFYIPSSDDITAIHLNGSFNYYSVGGGEKTPYDSTTLIDLSSGKSTDKNGNTCYKVSFYTNVIPVEYNVYVLSEIPSVYIGTSTGLSTLHANKNNRDSGATVKIYDSDGKTVYSDSDAGTNSELKARGNATFAYGKKPYQIKLGKKTDLFGMGKSKTWILLANYIDSSFLRNSVSYEIAKALELPFTPNSVYVNLFIDNQYLGLYQLIEKTQIGTNRIEISDLEDDVDAANEGVDLDSLSVVHESSNLPNLSDFWYVSGVNDPEDITGGYLVELDNLYAAAEKCKFRTSAGNTYVIKSPECASREQVLYIAKLFSEMEEGIYSNTGYNSLGKHFSEYCDVESFLKIYMVNEMTKNWDAFIGSTYFYKDKDADGVTSKIYAGPVWDYDNSYGNVKRGSFSTDKTALWANGGNGSIGGYKCDFGLRLTDGRTEYEDLLSEYCEMAADCVEQMLSEGGYIEQTVGKIRSSIAADRVRWGTSRTSEFVQYQNYEDCLGFLTDFMSVRAAAMTDYFVKGNADAHLTWEIKSDNTLKITGCVGVFTDLVIPSSIDGYKVTEIADEAFVGNTSIKSVSIPSSVMRIGTWAFGNCASLESVELYNGVTELSDFAFDGCKKLKSFDVPNSVTYIGRSVFGSCDALETVNLPYSVTYINGYDLFYHCYALKSISLPEGLTSIENYAFAECYSLTYIGIPSTVTSIDYTNGNMFRSCDSIGEVRGFKGTVAESFANYIGAKFTEYDSYDGFSYTTGSDGNIIITKYAGNSSSVYIPSKIDGKNVTSIGSKCFEWRPMSYLYIPETVTSISETAFRGLTNLKNIDVSSQNTEYTVSNGCLYTKNMKTLLLVPRNVSGVFVVPDGVESLCGSCFQSCSDLTKIVLPSSLKTISMFSFRDTGISSIKIPSGVSAIDEYAFMDCKNLASVTLNYGLEKIFDGAFENCKSLTSIKIPDSVTQINDSAFKNSSLNLICGTKGSAAESYANEHGIEFEHMTFNPTIAVDNISVLCSETFDLGVYLKNNPGVSSVKLSISYDESLLTLKKVTINGDLPGISDVSPELSSPVVVNWNSATKEIDSDFVFVTLTFEAVSDIEDEKTTSIEVTYDEDDIHNTSLDNVHFDVQVGTVTVNSHTPGDINGDGKVNNKDLTCLLQYVSGWDVNVKEKALDVNGDGKNDIKDALRLLKYLTNWPVEIH